MQVYHKQEAIVKKPGFEIWPKDVYEAEHGKLESNGKRKLGHYEMVDDELGDAVVIPDKNIKRVDFQEVHGAERRWQAGKTGDDVQPGFLPKRQAALADAMVPGFSGNFTKGDSVAELLTMPTDEPISKAGSGARNEFAGAKAMRPQNVAAAVQNSGASSGQAAPASARKRVPPPKLLVAETRLLRPRGSRRPSRVADLRKIGRPRWTRSTTLSSQRCQSTLRGGVQKPNDFETVAKQ